MALKGQRPRRAAAAPASPRTELPTPDLRAARQSEAALRQARDMIAANEKIDMARLSAELGVDRTTLFRWVGNRDQLMVGVMWSVAEPLFRDCVTSAEGTGTSYIAEVMRRWVAGIHEAPEFRAVVTRDPERALRLLAAAGSEFQRRVVQLIATLIEQEQEAGCINGGVASTELAQLVARAVGAYVWTDLAAGEPPDPDRAERHVAMLLNGADLA